MPTNPSGPPVNPFPPKDPPQPAVVSEEELTVTEAPEVPAEDEEKAE